MRAVCEQVAGSIYRSEPYDYYVQIGEDEQHIVEALQSHLSEKFEVAQIELTETPEAEAVVEESPIRDFDVSLKAGAMMFAQSNDAEMASAVVSAEFASLLAKSAADRMANAAIELQDNAIIPRLDAIEMRFEALEETISQSGPGDIETQLESLGKALESHAERLEGNLTQDRLDTLISLVSASGNNEPDTAMSNERLATAIEILLQTMQETLQPVPALMDPYFEQLRLQSEGLIKAISKFEQTEADVASLTAQLNVFRTMAESAPKQGSLSATEKMETLEEISSGLSGLMSRILGLVGYGPIATAPTLQTVEAALSAHEEESPVSEASEPSEIEEIAEAPVEDSVDADEELAQVASDDIEAEQPEMSEPAMEDQDLVDDADLDVVSEAEQVDVAVAETAEAEPIEDTDSEEQAAQIDENAPDEIAMDSDEEPIAKKLEFEPPIDAEATSPSKSTPTEEELDRRVEELLKSPRLSETAAPLQQKTG